jgi:hypothetical protein
MEQINKYHDGKIYVIRSYQTDKYYIGSTTQPLCKRLYDHRKSYQCGLRSVRSYKIIQYDDNYIELLEEYKCDTKQQLTKREGELIREYRDNCVNNNIPCRTPKEWIADNIEKFKSIQKKSYDKNGKDRNIKTKITCECGGHYIKRNFKIHSVTKKHLKFYKLIV